MLKNANDAYMFKANTTVSLFFSWLFSPLERMIELSICVQGCASFSVVCAIVLNCVCVFVCLLRYRLFWICKIAHCLVPPNPLHSWTTPMPILIPIFLCFRCLIQDNRWLPTSRRQPSGISNRGIPSHTIHEILSSANKYHHAIHGPGSNTQKRRRPKPSRRRCQRWQYKQISNSIISEKFASRVFRAGCQRDEKASHCVRFGTIEDWICRCEREDDWDMEHNGNSNPNPDEEPQPSKVLPVPEYLWMITRQLYYLQRNRYEDGGHNLHQKIMVLLPHNYPPVTWWTHMPFHMAFLFSMSFAVFGGQEGVQQDDTSL